MRRIWFGQGALLAVLLVGASGGLMGTPAANAQGGITFETPSIVDPVNLAGEPSIAINPINGRVFVSGPQGTGAQRSMWEGSADGGHTYRIISPAPPTAASGQLNQPGGGDTDITFDHKGTQYFSDLYALTCFRMAVTPDNGATVNQDTYPGGCAGEPPTSDRQWFAMWDPAITGSTPASAYKGPWPLVYFTYNGTAHWTKSTDGLNWSSAMANSNAKPFGPDGYPAVDPVTGKTFQAAGNGTGLFLNIGTPDASGNLTFLDNQSSAGLIKIADKFAAYPKAQPDDLFSVVSMDSARNLFVVTGLTGATGAEYQVFVSVASAKTGWTKWATPVQVSRPPSLTNIFTWIKAGGPGRADAVWYGSDKAGDPSTPIGQAWNVFMSQIVWPTDSDGAVITSVAPSTQMVKVSPHPMKYNDICLAGTGCVAQQGNRNLADFFSIGMDKTGAAEVVYDDTSNGLLQPGAPSQVQYADHAGAPVVTVARQNGGPGLLGYDVQGPSNAPRLAIGHASGSALFSVNSPLTQDDSLINGSEVPGMDVLESEMRLDGNTVVATAKVVDLSNPAATAAAVGAPYLQYVTRWQMGNTIYYAAMGNTAANQPLYYGGAATSTDLCSVSACRPMIIDYPEPPLGTLATGSVDCPASPSASDPCTLTIRVPASAVGNPTPTSLFEEVGSYALAATAPSVFANNATGEIDNVPLEVGGACCYNYEQDYRGAAIPLPAAQPQAPAGTSLPATLRGAIDPRALGVLLLILVAGLVAVLSVGRSRTG